MASTIALASRAMSTRYRLGNIPDATTDPSQIRVVPVIDPTAKPKRARPRTADRRKRQRARTRRLISQATACNKRTAASQAPTGNPDWIRRVRGSTDPVPIQRAQHDCQRRSWLPSPASFLVAGAIDPAAATGPRRQCGRLPRSRPAVSAGGSAGIPSSLKSQLASSTPEASGTKPMELRCHRSSR